MTAGPAGGPPSGVHQVRVYWEDTDAGGIVYHASHVRFFERGRTELLRTLGVSQSAMTDRSRPDPLFFTVRRMEVEYLRPALLDDLLTVETRVAEVGGSRFVLDQRLVRDGEILASAVLTIAVVGATGRPRRIPADLRSLFERPR